MLLTRAPLSAAPKCGFSFDLHVLSLPPAFVLSQDQTLKLRDSHPAQEIIPERGQPIILARTLSICPKVIPLETYAGCPMLWCHAPPPAHPFIIYIFKQRAPACVHLDGGTTLFPTPVKTPTREATYTACNARLSTGLLGRNSEFFSNWLKERNFAQLLQ